MNIRYLLLLLTLSFAPRVGAETAPHAYGIAAVFQTPEFYGLLSDNPYVAETAARLIQTQNPEFIANVGDCSDLTKRFRTDLYYLWQTLEKPENRDFMQDWAQRLELALSNAKNLQAVTIDLNVGSSTIAFIDHRRKAEVIYYVATTDLWPGDPKLATPKKRSNRPRAHSLAFSFDASEGALDDHQVEVPLYFHFYKLKAEFDRGLRMLAILKGKVERADNYSDFLNRFHSAALQVKKLQKKAQNESEREAALNCVHRLLGYALPDLNPATETLRADLWARYSTELAELRQLDRT